MLEAAILVKTSVHDKNVIKTLKKRRDGNLRIVLHQFPSEILGTPIRSHSIDRTPRIIEFIAGQKVKSSRVHRSPRPPVCRSPTVDGVKVAASGGAFSLLELRRYRLVDGWIGHVIVVGCGGHPRFRQMALLLLLLQPAKDVEETGAYRSPASDLGQ